MKTTNYHIIKVKYVGATDTKGSRVLLRSDLFKQTKSLSYDHRFNSALDIAENWLIENGFEVIGHGEGANNSDYVITSTFNFLNKIR